MKHVKGSKALVELLEKNGVEYIYGIPGATEVYLMNELENNDKMKYILGLNEMVCVGAAEGYGRAKGKPAVLYLHTGPGMAAAMPLLLNVKYGKVPMVILVGQNDSRLLSKDPQLSGDIVGMAKPVAKWATELHRAEDIPTVINRAFKMAMQKPMGPVVVSIPSDFMEETIKLPEREMPKYGYKSGRGDLEMIHEASNLIKNATNITMLVQESVAVANALDETVKLAELIGARVFQVWMGDVNFPVRHPLYCGDIDSTGPMMEKILKETDLLIGIGCQLFNDAFYSGIDVLPDTTKIIQIDEDPWEIGKNFPVDCGIQGDIKEVICELNGILEKNTSLEKEASRRIEYISKENMGARESLEAKAQSEMDNCPIAVSSMMSIVAENVSNKTYIVDDCWSSSGALRTLFDFKYANTLYRPRNGGSIGFGLPGALGVKMACPDKDVLVISGDGSAAWSMQTFWTAAHYNIPVTMIITNNGTYRQVKNVRKRILGDYPLNERHLGMEIDNPTIQFVELAKSMGVDGCQIKESKDLAEAIKKGMNSDKPYLIEVFVENSPV